MRLRISLALLYSASILRVFMEEMLQLATVVQRLELDAHSKVLPMSVHDLPSTEWSQLCRLLHRLAEGMSCQW